jgi:hypothetical protein
LTVPPCDFLVELNATLGEFFLTQSTYLVPIHKPADLALGIDGLDVETLELGLDDIRGHEAALFLLVLPCFGHELRRS